MSNREMHTLVGTAAGTLAAGLSAAEQKQFSLIVETCGGFVGGYCGSRAPDIIDPPISPNHRHIGHGVGNVAVVTFAVWEVLVQWQEWLRATADKLAAEREFLTNDFERVLSVVGEIVLRFIAGALIGFVVGYVSHLVLDAQTPRGLPLLHRNF